MTLPTREELVRDLLEAVVKGDRVVGWRVYCESCGYCSKDFDNQPKAVAAAKQHVTSVRHRGAGQRRAA